MRQAIQEEGKLANMKIKAEGGQGGKRGHSNMVHYAKTEEVKRAARRQRREDGKKSARAELVCIQAILSYRI